MRRMISRAAFSLLSILFVASSGSAYAQQVNRGSAAGYYNNGGSGVRLEFQGQPGWELQGQIRGYNPNTGQSLNIDASALPRGSSSNVNIGEPNMVPVIAKSSKGGFVADPNGWKGMYRVLEYKPAEPGVAYYTRTISLAPGATWSVYQVGPNGVDDNGYLLPGTSTTTTRKSSRRSRYR